MRLQVAAGLLVLAPCGWMPAQTRPFTIADTVEFAHVVHDYGSESVLVSPDRSRYIAIIHRGDIKKNGSSISILYGRLTSIDAAKPVVVADLFSRSTAQVQDLIKDVRWSGDSRNVSFIWTSGIVPPQVMSVNVVTRRMRALTHHKTEVVRYSVDSGGTIVYLARTKHDVRRLKALNESGFAIINQSAYNLLSGQIDGWYAPRHNEFYVSRAGGITARVDMGREYHREWLAVPDPHIRFSPDGHHVVLLRPAASVPESWDHYTDRVFHTLLLPGARQHPSGPNGIFEWALVDLKDGTAKPLLAAPANASKGDAAWSPDGRFVILGPAFTPPRISDDDGWAGTALVLVDVATGNASEIPVSLGGDGYRVMRWRSDGVVELTTTPRVGGSVTNLLKKVAEKWVLEPAQEKTEQCGSEVTVEVREGLNSPPALFAKDGRTGKEQIILDLNPSLRTGKVALAHVELVHWNARDGRPWSGLLFTPPLHTAGKTYPFVIQTHGFSPTEFAPGGSSLSTAFAAQALANHGIAVLQLGGPDVGGEQDAGTPNEIKASISGYEGAIQHFISAGVADARKIGIIGFSRTVWHVEYLLTHPNVAIAAAVVSDGIEGGYFEYEFAEAFAREQMNQFYGAAPIGEDLKAWMKDAPGFNVDKVHTPVRIEFCWGPIDRAVPKWEFFSNLRYLQKPVEMFIIPDVAHGVHQLQNPKQRLASLGGTVDWFRFWLKGEEDSDPAKAEQYARWRELRKLHQQNEKNSPAPSPN